MVSYKLHTHFSRGSKTNFKIYQKYYCYFYYILNLFFCNFRFRYEFKSQALWVELKFVLDNFAAPLLDLFEGMIKKVTETASNPEAQKQVIEVLVTICKVFYSLNYQVCLF